MAHPGNEPPRPDESSKKPRTSLIWHRDFRRLWESRSVSELGALLGGFLGTSIGVRNALWISWGGGTLAIVWLMASPVRTMRDFPVEHDDGSPPSFATTPESNHAVG